MDIDWITVAAQIVNFLILVWLLQHFLYGPITRAMERREQRIADRLREASEKREEAEAEAERYRDKQHELERRREQMMADARKKAEEQRKTLETEAREKVEERKQEWLGQLRDRKEAFLSDLRRHTVDRFFMLSRRALSDLANQDLESQMADVFVDRLRGLDEETRRKIARACTESNAAIVASRFELSANARRRLTRAIHDTIADHIEVDYRHSEETGCGIELRAGSQTVAWNFDVYFDSLWDELSEEITAKTRETGKQAAE